MRRKWLETFKHSFLPSFYFQESLLILKTAIWGKLKHFWLKKGIMLIYALFDESILYNPYFLPDMKPWEHS
jgi:hypothetical protein